MEWCKLNLLELVLRKVTFICVAVQLDFAMRLFGRNARRWTCFFAVFGSSILPSSVSQQFDTTLGYTHEYNTSPARDVQAPKTMKSEKYLATPLDSHCPKTGCDLDKIANREGEFQHQTGFTETARIRNLIHQYCSTIFSEVELLHKPAYQFKHLDICQFLFDDNCHVYKPLNSTDSSILGGTELNLKQLVGTTDLAMNSHFTTLLYHNFSRILEPIVRPLLQILYDSIAKMLSLSVSNMNLNSTHQFLSMTLSNLKSTIEYLSIPQRLQPLDDGPPRTERSVGRSFATDLMEFFIWLSPKKVKTPPVSAERRKMELGQEEQEDDWSEKCQTIRDSTACGLALSRGKRRVKRIVNGFISRDHEWPWMVSLYTVPDTFLGWPLKSLSCGGVLLNRQVVLSCAHCFDPSGEAFPAEQIYVIIGSNRLLPALSQENPVSHILRVQKLLIHPEYNVHFSHDLSLLLLERPVEYQVNIQPVCLPPPQETDFVGKFGTVLGWGFTSPKGDVSEWLRETDVRILADNVCKSWYARTEISFKLPEGSFCAGFENGQTDSCKGDSGSPLLVEDPCGIWQVAGIVSYGYSCAQPNQPGIYTDVIHHRDWITENIALLQNEGITGSNVTSLLPGV